MLLDGAGIACGRVNYPEEVLSHPQLAARDRWRDVDSPVGPAALAAAAARLAGLGRCAWTASPTSAQDTESILRELGRDQAAIDQLVATGVVGVPARRDLDAATT